jgi:hypothetical protein
VGIQNLAVSLGEESDTLEDVLERAVPHPDRPSETDAPRPRGHATGLAASGARAAVGRGRRPGRAALR